MCKPCTVLPIIIWNSSISGLICEAQDKHLILLSKLVLIRENSDPTNFALFRLAICVWLSLKACDKRICKYMIEPIE